MEKVKKKCAPTTQSLEMEISPEGFLEATFQQCVIKKKKPYSPSLGHTRHALF